MWSLARVMLCSLCSAGAFVSSLKTDYAFKSDYEPKFGIDDHVLRNFFEHAYPSGRGRGGGNAGEPLLLSPYIARGELKKARELSSVDADLIAPDVNSYAGYLTVDEKYNSNLWFWYFPVADRDPASTPWIIWLQGGPGASSLYGLFTEIGPLIVSDDTIEEMEFSWGKNHSLLFIDNPVGTGFSFTDSQDGYATNQSTIGAHLYDALQQFLTIFPELRAAPMFVAGESYAGKHIPSLAAEVHRGEGYREPINMQGLMIGNGFIDPASMQHYSAFVQQVGLVDERVAQYMAALEHYVTKYLDDKDTSKAFLYYNYLLNVFLQESRLQNLYNYMDEDGVELGGGYEDFIQRDQVRQALHVGGTNYSNIGLVYQKLIPDFMNSAKSLLEEVLPHYRVMCYSGQLDIIVAYPLSVQTYTALNFTGHQDYVDSSRNPWLHDGKLAGYYKVAGHLTEVMVRGAGHMVPADQPARALALVTAFINRHSLEEDTGILVPPPQSPKKKNRKL